MENSLSPAFIRIDMTSAYGPHTMTVPSVAAEPTTIGGSIYQFILRGAALPVAVAGAVEDFVDVLKPAFPTTYTFQGWTLFLQPTPEDTPTPVQAGLLGVAGTSPSTTWSKAVQHTLTWRTDEFGIFKLVLLDAVSGNVFDKLTNLSGNPTIEAISDYVTDDVTWVAGRDGGRPNVFLQMATTLNEKLRRSYRMN